MWVKKASDSYKYYITKIGKEIKLKDKVLILQKLISY
jgi:hypothetical protein